MKAMNITRLSLALVIPVLTATGPLLAQSGAAESTAVVSPAGRTNTAIVPAPPLKEAWRNRAETVLQRAKDHPGECDIVFIGDSITEFWETKGTNVWQRYYAHRKCLNLGVSGDRTQCVLWRFERGQLDGLKPKLAVLMIGTNNSPDNNNTEAEILEGVQAIVSQIRHRLPDTRILVLGIFPRGATFSVQRGRIVQVNQALAKLADGKMIEYMDIGSRLIESDGTISGNIMPDYLHLSERGYEIWAEAMEPKLDELLGK
jgi:lysophospholipase L1-like esterase